MAHYTFAVLLLVCGSTADFPARVLFFASSNEEFLGWAAVRDHASLYREYSTDWTVIHSNASVDLRAEFRDTPSTVEHVHCALKPQDDIKRRGSTLCILDWIAVHPTARDGGLTLYLEHDVYVRDMAHFVEQVAQIALAHTDDIYVHNLMDTGQVCGGNTQCAMWHRINGVSMWNFARFREHVRQCIEPGVAPYAPLRAASGNRWFCEHFVESWDNLISRVVKDDWDARVMEHQVMCLCNFCTKSQLEDYLRESSCTLYHAVSKNRALAGFPEIVDAFYNDKN